MRIYRVSRIALAAMSAAAVGAACSTTILHPESCTDNRDCRVAFGWGSVCESDGSCSAIKTDSLCTRTFPKDLLTAPEQYREAVVIGSLFSYTEHLGTLQAAELAVRLANASGISPYTFGMVSCDTTALANDPEQAATLKGTDYLVNTLGVPAIVGPRGTTRTEAAWSIAKESDVLVISPSATSTSLSALDNTMPTDASPGRLWRTVPDDTLHSLAIATDLRARNVDRISLIVQSGSYGEGLAQMVSMRFQADGGEAPTQEIYSSSLADAVGKVLDDDSSQEVVMISSDISDYIDFLNLATSSTASRDYFDARGVFMSDGAFNERLYTDPAASAELLFDNIRGSRPAPASGTLFTTFAFEYFGQFSESPDALAFTAHSYDAAWLVLYGSLWSAASEGEVTGTGIARGLRQVSEGPEVQIRSSSWPEVIEAFAALESINVTGASGMLDYNPDTEETSAPTQLWRLVDEDGWGFQTDGTVDPP